MCEAWVLKCYAGNNVACPEEIILFVINENECSWNEHLAMEFPTEDEAKQFAYKVRIGWAFKPEKIQKTND